MNILQKHICSPSLSATHVTKVKVLSWGISFVFTDLSNTGFSQTVLMEMFLECLSKNILSTIKQLNEALNLFFQVPPSELLLFFSLIIMHSFIC